MKSQPRAIRIAGWTTTLIGLVALSLIAYERFSTPPPAIEPFACHPMPSNVVKLGPAVIVRSVSSLPEINAMGWPELRTELRQGDVVRTFETRVTGGHLAMRGNCYLGQAIAWMR